MNCRTVPKTIAFKLSACSVLCTGTAAVRRIRFTAAAGLTGVLMFAALMRPAVCFSDSTPAPNAEQMDDAPARSIVHPGDGAVMVYIPPGPFTMGNDSGWLEERPEHIVDLPGFYIDRYEVSIDMFRRFVDSGAYKNPGFWMDGEIRQKLLAGEYDRTDWSIYSELMGDVAMFHVRFAEADAYCRWAGKHLPTPQQWEKAARGTDGRAYPWGNDWSAEKCYCLAPEAFFSGINTLSAFPASVFAFPEGDSPYGVRQMTGNVWEWCGTGMLPYPGNTDPYKFYATFWGVFQPEIRGGCWTLDPRFCTTTFRSFGDPGVREKTYGFRCACEEGDIDE